MNPGLDMLRDGFQASLDIHGWQLVIARTGQQFCGLIEPAPPIDPALSLGPDPREKSILHVLQEAQLDIVINDQISPCDDLETVWTVLYRDNNQSDFVTKYWLVAVVDQKDQ